MKYGVEVEGKFRGLQTLFMTVEEYKRRSLTSISKVLPSGLQVQQLYVTDQGNEMKPKDVRDACTRWGEMLTTIEVSVYEGGRDLWLPHVHFMLNITDFRASNSSFWMLRHSDQIKFNLHVGDGASHVMCIPKTCMMITHPDEFKNDIELELPPL